MIPFAFTKKSPYIAVKETTTLYKKKEFQNRERVALSGELSSLIWCLYVGCLELRLNEALKRDIELRGEY